MPEQEEKIVWTEASAQTEIAYFCRCRQHKLIIPNFGAFPYFENDLVSITNSDFAHVFEIKTSRSDFLKEFGNGRAKRNKLDRLCYYRRKSTECANYFWLVCPKNIIKSEDEIPEWAGIIWLHEVSKVDGHWKDYRIGREAPRLHRTKTSDKTLKSIARGLSIRFWDYRIRELINK